MKTLSLNPDPDIAWIYDSSHRDYNTELARNLRESRSMAIASAPEWMVIEAKFNDTHKDLK